MHITINYNLTNNSDTQKKNQQKTGTKNFMFIYLLVSIGTNTNPASKIVQVFAWGSTDLTLQTGHQCLSF